MNPTIDTPKASRPYNRQWLIVSLALSGVCWALLWTVRTYWNPLLFFGLWTGAILTAQNLAGQPPLLWRRHLMLSALSIPLWWWFEFLNSFVHNWQYHGVVEYSELEYRLFASIAFSTVIPALDAAWALALALTRPAHPVSVGDSLRRELVEGREVSTAKSLPRWWWALQLAIGAMDQTLVFLWPSYFYALVWVAPFLAFDALLGLTGGVSLVAELWARRWRLPLAIGLAGVGCGFCWELWNFWALPKWTYSVPFFHFLQLFEMPLLGYGGYIPFSWSVYQMMALLARRWPLLRPAG